MNQMTWKPMLNAYPDSIGKNLSEMVRLLETELKDCFDSFYVLPSLYHSDLDRGFCVVDYDLDESLATQEDLASLQNLGISLKLDLVLNHLSVNSPQFQDLLQKGESSDYCDFFINWNDFWAGCGQLSEEGYLKPEDRYIQDMFFRKPGLPILMVPFPDGRIVPYWNTFYQKVWEENGERHYLGQMDLNLHSPKVWDFYEETLKKLATYGATIIRLDAFAYASKAPGRRNFLNYPETWEILSRTKDIADQCGMTLIPEIHAGYEEQTYKLIANQGYITYDFFLPGLIIDAIESHSGQFLVGWAKELYEKKIQTVNMLGCHDGIPMLDLKGLLEADRIDDLINILVQRGGHVKELHGKKNMYYQVNATYFSALGEDEQKLLLARAIQMFMPGKPQIWYLDLFAGANDYERMRLAGADGHKEINRTNLTTLEVKEKAKLPVVQEQLRLLKLRNSHPAFTSESQFHTYAHDEQLVFEWSKGNQAISLHANLRTYHYKIREVTTNE